MPAVTRVGLDSHVGHASPTPNPFHKTAYASGSGDVTLTPIPDTPALIFFFWRFHFLQFCFLHSYF